MKREHLLSIRLTDEELRAIDEWRRKQPTIPSRPQAVRELVRRGLCPDD